MLRKTRLLGVTLAVSLIFSPPGMAKSSENEVPKNADELRSKIVALSTTEAYKDFETFDSQGDRTTIEKVLSDPQALESGFSVGVKNTRIGVRGELIDGGKAGVMLVITKVVNGQVTNGQVMTLKPGLSRLELENRFRDLALSFASENVAAGKKGSRTIAHMTPEGCVLGGLVALAMAGACGLTLKGMIRTDIGPLTSTGAKIVAGIYGVAFVVINIAASKKPIEQCAKL